MTNRRYSLPALVACLVLVAGCGGDDGGEKSSAGASSRVEVNIASFKFVPDPVKVKAGGVVRWTNQDKAPHTAEAVDGAPGEFDTKRLDLGKKGEVKLDKPGAYEYYCRYHRFMTGKVEVVE